MRKIIVELIVGIAIIATLAFVIFTAIKQPSPSSSVAVATQRESMHIPAPSNYLVDNANVLSPSLVAVLNGELASFDAGSGHTAQIGVLIVTSTQPYDLEQYSIAVADSWKIGYKGSNNGILFILATVDRKVRIEVGKGFEGTLTDVQTSEMLSQYAVPYFKNQNWNGGVKATVEALINKLK